MSLKSISLVADEDTNSIPTIEAEHLMIHAGRHYSVSSWVSMSSTGTYAWMFTTPAAATAEIHMQFDIECALLTQIDILEGSTLAGTAASALTPINSKRSSANTSNVTVHSLQTGATAGKGTVIHTAKLGSSASAGKASGKLMRSDELILKASTKYLIWLIAGANSDNCSLNAKWYEVIP